MGEGLARDWVANAISLGTVDAVLLVRGTLFLSLIAFGSPKQ